LLMVACCGSFIGGVYDMLNVALDEMA